MCTDVGLGSSMLRWSINHRKFDRHAFHLVRSASSGFSACGEKRVGARARLYGCFDVDSQDVYDWVVVVGEVQIAN